MSIVNAIAKMAKPAAKILMGAAVTAGVVSVFSSCQKEKIEDNEYYLNTDLSPNDPVHPEPNPNPVNPGINPVDPGILEKLKELLEQIQSLDSQAVLVVVAGQAHQLPEEYEAKFWAWFEENKPEDFETNPASAQAFGVECLKKIQRLAIELNITQIEELIQEIINSGITPTTLLETVLNALTQMNGDTQMQMTGILVRAMSLPKDKQEEFLAWFNENKPASFGSNAMHTNSFINECKEKLDQLEGKVIRPKSSKKLNTEA